MGAGASDRSADALPSLTTQASAHEAAIGWLAALGHPGGSRCYLSGLERRTACVISSASALAHLGLGVAVTHAEALQDLVADTRGCELRLFYFSSGTYSETALAYAERFCIALFTYDCAGIVSHANAAAMTAILAAPDVATPPTGPDTACSGGPTGVAPFPSAAHEADVQAWAASVWQARQAPAPGRAFLAYLPLGVSLLVGLLMLPVVWAWQTGAGPALRVERIAVAVVVFHAFCAGGVWRVTRWRGRLRRHCLHIVRACTVPSRARALVDAAMQRSGRGVPPDHEAFVLLRNEVIGLSGMDPFTAGVLVWEVTIGAARPADRREWLGAPHGDHPATS